ncbi:heavy metal-responsive transcriptional regulator [Rubrobacter xylanophilus]|uniref:Heavy metal-responsive transcriptional regulator n=1 Tax=Rubrobacter xylanophilus TaxID=49319 RepID=A0A510HKC3_9ACTN|nr:heavy metal-responsive transcriptional regulator [Rubrobacter xylanophilus]BBL80471.1 heavy metal-responsive transcriptional regulator [Rubrobacter xylanophilus]
MRIGELAKRLDLNPQTIRYYERIGLLPEPERTAAGYRSYSGEDLRRLKFIKRARSVGFSLGEIKEILAFHDRNEPPCVYVTETIARRAGEIERRIAELTNSKRELERLYEQAIKQPPKSDADSYCHIIEPRGGQRS